MTAGSRDEVEPVEAFRLRLRAWLAANVPPWTPERGPRGQLSDEEELAAVAEWRELQRAFFDAGFAGIVVPREYGGAGLTAAHAEVLNQEIVGYRWPARAQTPTFVPCMALLLEFGTHEQKLRHVPRMLAGSEIWMQMLSEPSGGSDVAAARTTAVRDGDEWILNGSKIWTTGAWWADWALCLARTDWDVPKHRGLTVFMVPLDAPGIEIHRIEMLNGSREFCQEFLTDVVVPDACRLGDVDDGWTIGTRWMTLEKSFAVSPYIIRPGGRRTVDLDDVAGRSAAASLARRAGRSADLLLRDRIGEYHALGLAGDAASTRIGRGIRNAALDGQAGALTRLLMGTHAQRQATLMFELAGPDAITWTDDDADLGRRGDDFLTRQSSSIAGGTIEMARNVASERLLGMPRERSDDRGIAFRDVPHQPDGRRPSPRAQAGKEP